MIFIIGGMDPKTKTVAIPAVSEAVGIPLTLHQESLEHIRLKAQLKEEDGRENETYAYLPQDAVVFKNDLGVAPAAPLKRISRPF